MLATGLLRTEVSGGSPLLFEGRGDSCMPLSQNSCLLETEIARAPFRRCADDDVVEQFVDQFRRIEFLLKQRLLGETLSQIKRRHEFQCFGRTDSLDFAQFLDRTAAQLRE